MRELLCQLGLHFWYWPKQFDNKLVFGCKYCYAVKEERIS